MTTKKQLKTQERKRYEQLQQKIAARRARRARAWKIAGVSVVALVALGAIVLLVWSMMTDDAAPADVAASPTASVAPDDSSAAPALEPTATEDEGLVMADGWGASPAPPDPSLAEDRIWTAVIETNQGALTVELDGTAAPQAVASFVALAGDGFFNQTDCHRLVTAGIFVVQCGDPLGTGTGGPSYRYGPIENAPADDVYPAGTVAMARQGGNAESMGSQFFVVYEDSTIPSDAAGGYTVLGTVTDGLAMVEGVAQSGTITGATDGRPATSMIINEVSVS